MTTLRRLAPVVYAVILIALLLFVSTAAFLTWLIVGAVLIGLLYAVTQPCDGRQRNRRRNTNL